MSRRTQFTPGELAYLLEERKLGRVATVGEEGTPHVVPTGWRYNPERNSIDVTGADVASTQKFRDGRGRPRAAIVIDDLASVSPWRPRAVEVRGRAEAVAGEALIRIHPERIVSWGLAAAGR